MMRKIWGIFLSLFLMVSCYLPGADLKCVKQVRLSDKVMVEGAMRISVTEDNLYIVLDFKAANAKVFNANGECVTVIGSKGYGPGEFGIPINCSYSNRKLAVADVGQHRIFIYDRQGAFEFKRSQGLVFSDVGDDILLHDGALFLTGILANKDGEFFSLSIKPLKEGEPQSFFLPSHIAFGFHSPAELKTELYEKREFTVIGNKGIFDIGGKYVYYVWEGDLKIFKINLETSEISTFGKKTSIYVKPYTNAKLIEAFFNRNGKYVFEKRHQMSYIRDIFVTADNVLVTYTFPSDEAPEEDALVVQFYTLSGIFLEEKTIPGMAYVPSTLDKTKNRLYLFKSDNDQNLDEKHSIYEYQLK